MCLTVPSSWQLKYNNVLNPEEVYFPVTRVICQRHSISKGLTATKCLHLTCLKSLLFGNDLHLHFKMQFTIT